MEQAGKSSDWVHPFERAGLGTAPFKCVGFTVMKYQACPGAPVQCACKRAIPAGSFYCAVSWVFEGSADSVKRCGACQKTHEHLRGKDPELWPDERLNCGLKYEDEWGGEPPPDVARLPLLTDAEAGELLRGSRP